MVGAIVLVYDSRPMPQKTLQILTLKSMYFAHFGTVTAFVPLIQLDSSTYNSRPGGILT